jgi:hypothetical protein
LKRREFWQSMPSASYAVFLGGVFLMFLPVGLLGDIANQGSDSPSRLVAEMLFSGGLAVAYVLASRRPAWLLAVIPIHVLGVARTSSVSSRRVRRRWPGRRCPRGFTQTPTSSSWL